PVTTVTGMRPPRGWRSRRPNGPMPGEGKRSARLLTLLLNSLFMGSECSYSPQRGNVPLSLHGRGRGPSARGEVSGPADQAAPGCRSLSSGGAWRRPLAYPALREEWGSRHRREPSNRLGAAPSCSEAATLCLLL